MALPVVALKVGAQVAIAAHKQIKNRFPGGTVGFIAACMAFILIIVVGVYSVIAGALTAITPGGKYDDCSQSDSSGLSSTGAYYRPVAYGEGLLSTRTSYEQSKYDGADYEAAGGVTITSISDGTVDNVTGDAVTIVSSTPETATDGTTANVNYYLVYSNVTKISVSKGGTVSAGDDIAEVANKGTAALSATHLHLEIWKDRVGPGGTSQDPEVWMSSKNARQLGDSVHIEGLSSICQIDGTPVGGGIDTGGGITGGLKGGGAGPWGGFSNGKIPASALCPIPWAPGQMLQCDARNALIPLNEAFKAQFGSNIGITDSYRSYEAQVATKAKKGALAATPGTSNHGWGLALDLASGINRFGTPTHNWMRANAPKFGWDNPSWAHDGRGIEEAWHWEYMAASGPVSTGSGGSYSGGGNCGAGNSPAVAKCLGQSMMAAYGWGNPTQWTCLNNLWMKESGWKWNADNPSSSAYGIPQSLPGSKMKSSGADWATNPATQIDWGLKYIKGRYGNPCGAWAHSQQLNWY